MRDTKTRSKSLHEKTQDVHKANTQRPLQLQSANTPNANDCRCKTASREKTQLKRYSNLAHRARWACRNHILIMLRSPYNGGDVILIKSVLSKEIARSETVGPFVSTVLLNTRCIARAVLTYIFFGPLSITHMFQWFVRKPDSAEQFHFDEVTFTSISVSERYYKKLRGRETCRYPVNLKTRTFQDYHPDESGDN